VFGLGLATKIYVAVEAVDMRKGFDGLMVWDGSGLWVCAKRLEKGRYRWPAASEKQRSVTMRAEELAMLVNGLDLKQTRPRNWYRRTA
jgi:transposase